MIYAVPTVDTWPYSLFTGRLSSISLEQNQTYSHRNLWVFCLFSLCCLMT